MITPTRPVDGALAAVRCGENRGRRSAPPPNTLRGDADVVVCDGFTGNVALQLSEGLVEMVEDLGNDMVRRLKHEMAAFAESES